jgi:2-dehydro-3-deoxyphosphogluconate aldolase/(4S)-4-hydroxy-2-oxoglutarate aldolase
LDKHETLARISEDWISFIMRGQTADETLATVEGLIEGGAKVVEVTFTTPNVCRVIEALRRQVGERVVIMAGTVRTVDQVAMAVDAGADAIVAPNLYPPVLEAALEAGKVAVPGCLTPTEAENAWRLGADIVKLFPCDGPSHLGEFTAPFPDIPFLPAGAMSLDLLAGYRNAGAFAVVVGVPNAMRLADAIRRRQFAEIAATTRQWVARARVVAAGTGDRQPLSV